MGTVLLIEDDKDLPRIWKRQFDLLLKGQKICLLFATSIDEAAEQFKLHQKEISAIVFDGCIAGHGAEPNTKILVEVFRKSFKGPMIAASSLPHLSKILVDAGCSHQCHKEDVPKMVVQLLGLV
jgi:hypothetical protein